MVDKLDRLNRLKGINFVAVEHFKMLYSLADNGIVIKCTEETVYDLINWIKPYIRDKKFALIYDVAHYFHIELDGKK